MATTAPHRRGVSLAKGPIVIAGLLAIAHGVLAIIFGGNALTPHVPDGRVGGGHFLGLLTDGWTDLLTREIAWTQAFIAGAFDLETHRLATEPPSPVGVGAALSWTDVFAGGVPLRRDRWIVGTIGVSGGRADQDHAVAVAARCAL